jgi:hypothetical protein
LTDTGRTTERLTITDIAIRERLGYQVARERALKGCFGPVERVDGRLYVVPQPDRAAEQPHGQAEENLQDPTSQR